MNIKSTDICYFSAHLTWHVGNANNNCTSKPRGRLQVIRRAAQFMAEDRLEMRFLGINWRVYPLISWHHLLYRCDVKRRVGSDIVCWDSGAKAAVGPSRSIDWGWVTEPGNDQVERMTEVVAKVLVWHKSASGWPLTYRIQVHFVKSGSDWQKCIWIPFSLELMSQRPFVNS